MVVEAGAGVKGQVKEWPGRHRRQQQQPQQPQQGGGLGSIPLGCMLYVSMPSRPFLLLLSSSSSLPTFKGMEDTAVSPGGFSLEGRRPAGQVGKKKKEKCVPIFLGR